MRLSLIISFILISICGYSQRNYLYGAVTDSANFEPMSGVHIMNPKAGLLTNTDENGAFKIPVQPGDSLVFTYVGYESVSFIVEESPSFDLIDFYMTQNVTLLTEVEVNVFPEYWRFKQQILNTQAMDSTHVIFGLDAIPIDAYEVAANEQDLPPPVPDYAAPAIGIGFSLDGLTKKGKEKKKLQKILAQKETERAAYRKFNREWVAEETNLKGDELTDFIAYCKFSTKYLVETTLFEIHKEMMTLLAEFKAERNKSGNQNYSPGA